MTETALVIALDRFQTIDAKTAHGMVRGPSRYRIVGLIETSCAGRDAGEALDGRHRDIPIDASLAAALARLDETPDVCVVGVATPGGVIPEELRAILVEAAGAGMKLVNGLHFALADDPVIARAAEAAGVELIDFRRPRPPAELRFWRGDILGVSAPRVAVLGTDCAIGKRTTASLLCESLIARGVRADMVYTGQSGYLQGYRHGFMFDATPNDFVPGELEAAVVACARESEKDIIFLEGQASFRNPSGPCGAELLLSGAAQGVILQHMPARTYFKGFDHLDCRLPPIEDEVALIGAYGVPVWAVTLNASRMDDDAAEIERARIEDLLNVPVVLPLRDGVTRVAETLCHHLNLTTSGSSTTP